MGVRRWLWAVLSRGEEAEQDPDEFVEIALVSYLTSQLTVTRLEEIGITAFAIARTSIPGEAVAPDLASIRVAARDVDAAEEALRRDA
jgi:hypothetical protein